MKISILFIIVIIGTALLLVNGQRPIQYAPVNPSAPNPWTNANPTTQQTAPTPYPPMQNLQYFPTMNNVPNNFEMPASSMVPGNPPQFQFPIQNQMQANPMQQQQPMFQNPQQYPMQGSYATQNPIQNQNPLQYTMQQPSPTPNMGAFSSNAQPDYTFTTQQFRAPTRPQQFSFPSFQAPRNGFGGSGSSSQFSLPSFQPPSNAFASSASSASSAPSLPNFDPSVFNSMASTIAPTLSRGASQLSSIPSTIMQQTQEQVAQSSQAAGMTTEQGQEILQTAMQRGASILTPPRSKPTTCEKMDFECQFYKACYGCFGNRNQPHCMHCLNLDNCAGDLTCQTQRACPVCQRLPASEPKPSACDLLKC